MLLDSEPRIVCRNGFSKLAETTKDINPLLATRLQPGLVGVYASASVPSRTPTRHRIESIYSASHPGTKNGASSVLGVHHLLTTTRGWSQERYQLWLESTVKASVLATDSG